MEHDTKTEANLEKAWQKLSESFIPRENLIPSDTFGDDDEESPEMIANAKQQKMNDTLSDVVRFLQNSIEEVEYNLEQTYYRDEQREIWNDVRYRLTVIKENYSKKITQ